LWAESQDTRLLNNASCIVATARHLAPPLPLLGEGVEQLSSFNEVSIYKLIKIKYPAASHGVLGIPFFTGRVSTRRFASLHQHRRVETRPVKNTTPQAAGN